MVKSLAIGEIMPFDCKGDSTSVGLDGSVGKQHFNFTLMAKEL